MASSSPSPRDAPHLAASPSTLLDDHHQDPLVSAVNAAFQTLSTSPSSPALPASVTANQDMGRSPPLSVAKAVDIVVASDQLILRGTGVDVEPALLSGNVVLNLTEPTSIKQINLVFRGKARVPSTSIEPHVLGGSSSQYVVCNHEWTFLEGPKSHSHTLKAGRHLFPFELRVGGSLPSSVATLVNGGSSVSYKLRATVVRSSLSANLTAIQPITITRSFAPESLEYQQTLEIENTWPEKLMYALMVPHKAWAAGDELTTLVKFAPLAKGVRVMSITSNLCETTRTLAKGGHLEKTRVVVSRRHEIVRGRAVSVDAQERLKLHQLLHNTLASSSSVGSHLNPSVMSRNGPQSGSASPFYVPNAGSTVASGISTPLGDGMIPLSRQSFATTSSSSSSEEIMPSYSTPDALNYEDEDHDFESEISTTISISLPPSLTSSHPLDPIIVSYRIRWSILLSNLDGHTSELRCSLPVHILDFSLLDEARKASSVTRRLLLGGPDAEPDAAEEDAQLPSYPSHVRDRIPLSVAAPEVQAFLPYAYVPNSSHNSGTCTPMEGGSLHAHPHSQSYPSNLSSLASMSPLRLHPQPGSGSGSASGSNSSSPSMGSVELPSVAPATHVPGSRNMTAFSSLAHEPPSRPASRHGRDRTGERDVGGEREREPGRAARWFPQIRSRVNSRAGSRAASPERLSHSSSTNTFGTDSPSSSPGVASVYDTHVHSNTPATRQQHGVFNAMMKPLTGLSAQFAHSHSHTMALTNTISHHSPPSGNNLHGMHMGRAATVAGTTPLYRTPESSSSVFPLTGSPDEHSVSNSSTTGSGRLHSLSSHYMSQSAAPLANPSPDSTAAAATAFLQRAFTLVPDYTTASRSGSVAPLESLQGLPTYEDSEAHIHGAPWRSTPPIPQVSASTSRA